MHVFLIFWELCNDICHDMDLLYHFFLKRLGLYYISYFLNLQLIILNVQFIVSSGIIHQCPDKIIQYMIIIIYLGSENNNTEKVILVITEACHSEHHLRAAARNVVSWQPSATTLPGSAPVLNWGHVVTTLNMKKDWEPGYFLSDVAAFC